MSRTAAVLLLLASCVSNAAYADSALLKVPGTWTGSIQTGVAERMQLSLGGLFNPGPAWQNRLTIQGVRVFRPGDSIQLYGWSTTDLKNDATDADIGIRYRTPVARVARTTITGGSGLEYWHFPSVLGGTRDMVLDSYLGWNVGGERFPITISGNGKTLLQSRLPLGTMGIFQAQHTQKLYKWQGQSLTLQHGPIYVYNWDLYGKGGHRVLRYCGALQFGSKMWGVEATYRPQAGLQAPIPNNRFWSISIIRRFGL